jgi:pimeloyl-ACP methyl ester carboxylesterase
MCIRCVSRFRRDRITRVPGPQHCVPGALNVRAANFPSFSMGCYAGTVALPLPKLDVATREIAAFARQAWLLRHDALRPVLPADAQAGDDVVVCLHGLFATAGVLRPLRERLERHARVRTATMTYPPGPGIAALGRQLGELLRELPDGCRVHLLGHSVGGVVARWFAQEIGDGRLLQTISMAAPFAGVRSAGWLEAVGLRGPGLEVTSDLEPQSPLLRKLRLGSQRRLGTPHLSVIAENDAVVAGPIQHALPGGDVVVVKSCGHNALLFHERVAEIVETRVLAFGATPR